MLWLYLHFPSLQLDSLFSGDKQNEHPLIIVDEKTHKVIQANSLALDSRNNAWYGDWFSCRSQS